MPINPIEHVLARMTGRNITRGWGAVAAIARKLMNDMLHEQYRQRLSDLRFLPLFNAVVDHEDHVRTRSKLRNIEFGAPLLSFTNASLSDSRAQLTFPIVAGEYLQRSPLAENLLTSFIIDESMGFTLVMAIELRLVTGEVDHRGRVTLDLREASSFSCNLAGAAEHVNERIAAAIEKEFADLPQHRGQFELGMLDFSGYTALTPTHFRILTQAAPGAKTLGADNYGDGAVLAFIQLQANDHEGELPEHDFPYLIPDDRNSDGSEKYSATMVVDKSMLKHVTDDRLDVLASLLFSTSHKFAEKERHEPHDLAVFGTIDAVPALYSIRSKSATMLAGEKQQFTLVDQQGAEVRATNWFARSRQSRLAIGDGKIDGNGLYQAVGLPDIGHHSLTILITAEIKKDSQMHRATTQLVVHFEHEQVSPQIGVFAARTPMVLSAALQADEINWSLLGEQHGQLDRAQGKRVTFIAEKPASRRQLSVQRVQAKGQQQRMSTLVMLNGLQSLAIEPARTTGLEAGQSVSLRERDPAFLAGAQRRWRLIGPGQLEGRNYTAPSGNERGTSVVVCEAVNNGVVLAAGYSLLAFGEPLLAEEGRWHELRYHKVTVPGGDANESYGELINHGLQPLHVAVEIEPLPVDGKYYRLSEDERASIGLYFEGSKQRLVALNDDNPSGGIEKDDLHRWGTRNVPNRFQPAYPVSIEAREENVTRRVLYLHCGDEADVDVKLYSGFRVDVGGTETSLKFDSQIVVRPKTAPVRDQSDYYLTPVRVEGGGDNPDPNRPIDPEMPDDPAFDFHLKTIDYWAFRLKDGSFETAKFIKRSSIYPVHQSMIRWESEHHNETMFSFTGTVFRDRFSKEEEKWMNSEVKIVFDERLQKLMGGRKELDTDVLLERFVEGAFVITNHRVPDFSYKAPGELDRDTLSEGFYVLLRDHQGNPHYLYFKHEAPLYSSPRNYIDYFIL
ncbi:hypothetical protein ACOKS3_02025 [Pseudomonas sp. HS6-2]|uniref:hypothetical protein n=1 Tax=Pseudomonas sp. HS6-2 TaxID=3410986 RepID=UPI003BDB56F6